MTISLTKMRLAAVMAVLTLFALPVHDAVAALEPLTFKMYPQGVAVRGNPVIVEVKGQIYRESWWFHEVKAKKFTPSPDEAFVMKVVEVNRSGTLKDQLSLWPQNERAETAKTFGDPAFLAGNQNYFRQIKASAFLAKIAYGPYLIFFVQQSGPKIGDDIVEYPILKQNGAYYLSNRMQDDPIFNFLTLKIKEFLKLKPLVK